MRARMMNSHHGKDSCHIRQFYQRLRELQFETARKRAHDYHGLMVS